MRLAILAARNSIHTLRWVNELATRGHTVHLLTMHHGGDVLHPDVQLHRLPRRAPQGYFLNAPALRAQLRALEPDLLHAHYASGYGTLGMLSRFHPFVLSVYGSDVYEFPASSGLNRRLLRANLRAADWICSTSEVMAAHTRTYAPARTSLTVTPFGIDTARFTPAAPPEPVPALTIGTVKTLAPKYGIDLLISAFARARADLARSEPDLARQLRLRIVGGGPAHAELVALAERLGLGRAVQFVGPVPHSAVPGELHQLDIYVAASRFESESFGVAVLEASACGLPVVVSDVGGLPEVVRHGESGLVVPHNNVAALADALLQLVRQPALRAAMGAAGRQLVLGRYRWHDNVTLLERVYAAVTGSATGTIRAAER